MKTYILTEANQNIGMGHLMRCLAFYKEFTCQEWEVSFVLEMFDYTKPIIKNNKYHNVNWVINFQELSTFIQSEDMIFIDTISLKQSTLDYFRTNITKNIIVIDDWLRLKHTDSVVIDWTVNVENTTKHNHNLIDNTVLLGHRYSVLRSAFINQEKYHVRDNIENIMITMGGADVRELTEPLIQYLSETYPRVCFNVVIGSGFSIQQYKEYKNVNYHYGLDDIQMAGLMQRNDVCIAAAGQTLYELTAIGIPTIAIQVVDNQSEDIEGMLSLQLISTCLIWNNSELLSELESHLNQLDSYTLRKPYCEKAHLLKLGAGMPLIIDEIKQKFNL